MEGQPKRAGLLRLVARGEATTRAELARAMGQSPSTTAGYVESLLHRGLLEEDGTGSSTGGRPPRVLKISAVGGTVIGLDLGERHMQARASDLAGRPLESTSAPINLAEGPEVVASRVAEVTSKLACLLPGPVLAVGIALPGPVAQPTGIITSPSRIPGWDRVHANELFSVTSGIATKADNDANLLALGEYHTVSQPPSSMIAVKIARGIGCGVMSNHQLLRGQSGAAGDISHSRAPSSTELCDCGKRGCLEAVASGAALVRRAQARGEAIDDPAELVALAIAGSREAQSDLRTAGRAIGEALARFVDFFNPAKLTLGGVMSSYGPLTASLRTAIHENALPLATEHLQISTTVLGPEAIAFGATHLAIDSALAQLQAET